MSAFRTALDAVRPARGAARRRWVFVPYDQLSDRIGPLARIAPHEAGIVLIETPAKAARRPYHRQKLALVLANLRHFALEQARRGVAVRHVVSPSGYASALAECVVELGPVVVAEPAERELRVEIAPLVERGAVVVEPHDGWLTTREQFLAAVGARPPWRMDAFYRHVRRASGILMERGKPAGGRLSFDAENRQRWDGIPAAPEPPRYEPDSVTREVGELVTSRYSSHPGRLDLQTLPATAADAARAWDWARRECLRDFGPYEDALSTRSRGLFHTRVAPLLNLHRVLPADVVRDAAACDAPLQSREGFVRQVLGWREFVRHVHRETDGFRVHAPQGARAVRGAQGAHSEHGAHRAHSANLLGAHGALPPAYWGKPSGLACLDHVVAGVLDEGWSHHIARLMVLANVATLLDVSPRELTDWFWALYVDAYDWVVEPNVLAMGTFAVGDVMTTKPYVAGAAYVDRMSDFCGACAFRPGVDCPLTPLYWAFLARHAETLARTERMRLPLASLAKRAAARRAADASVFAIARDALARGEVLKPASFA